MSKTYAVEAVTVLVSGVFHVEISKIILYFRRMLCRFSVFWFPIRRFVCEMRRFVVRKWRLVVRKWRLVVWLLGFRVWFLYDCVADVAFGNL